MKMPAVSTTVYSQRDPQWAGLHLGLPQAAAGSTLGEYGCAVTAIAQKLTLIGFPTTPPMVQSRLLQFRAFRIGGTNNLVDWPKVPLAYPQLQFNGRGDYFTGKPTPQRAMLQITDRLLMNEPVIIYVDASQYEKGLQQHFVLVTSVLQSGALLIHNPWNGKIQTLEPYGKTDPIAVCGIILLDKRFDASKAI